MPENGRTYTSIRPLSFELYAIHLPSGEKRAKVSRAGVCTQAIGAITHRLCRLIWKILHERVRYEERGPAVSVEAKKVRARKMIRELRSLGYRVELLTPPTGHPA